MVILSGLDFYKTNEKDTNSKSGNEVRVVQFITAVSL